MVVKLIVGIDPGLKGGIAFIPINLKDHGCVTYPMPIITTKKKVKGKIKTKNKLDGKALRDIFLFADAIEIVKIYIEEVHSMPKQGVASTFSFGKTYGQTIGILEGLGYTPEFVRPQVWKKDMGVTSDKNTSIAKAEYLFPNAKLIAPKCRKVHDGMAEALLIAEYGKRTYS